MKCKNVFGMEISSSLWREEYRETKRTEDREPQGQNMSWSISQRYWSNAICVFFSSPRTPSPCLPFTLHNKTSRKDLDALDAPPPVINIMASASFGKRTNVTHVVHHHPHVDRYADASIERIVSLIFGSVSQYPFERSTKHLEFWLSQEQVLTPSVASLGGQNMH